VRGRSEGEAQDGEGALRGGASQGP